MMAGGLTNGRLAFRRWRRNRPFWGGFLMILSGIFLFASGNLDLGDIQIHLGVTGFLSYIVPAFMIIVGALAWATPDQRMLYGILGIIAALFSVVSVNLGGFILGMLLGIIGGALTVAWVPVKHTGNAVPAERSDAPMPDDDGAHQATDQRTADQVAVAPDGEPIVEEPGGHPDDESGIEGKQGARFRHARHASADRVAGELITASLPDTPAAPRNIRPLLAGVAALALAGSIAVVTLQSPQSAAAAATDCTTPSMSQLIQSATARTGKAQTTKTPSKSSNATTQRTKTSTTKTSTTTSSRKAASKAAASRRTQSAVTSGGAVSARKAPAASVATTSTTGNSASTGNGRSAGPMLGNDPIGTLLGNLGKLLSGGTPAPSESPSAPPTAAPTSASPTSPTPSRAPTAAPSNSPPAPSKAPTAPATTPATTPASRTAKPTPPGHPAASPSARPECAVVSKRLAAAAGQVDVQETPAVMKVDTLTMSGLSYDGTVDLPTKSGSISVLQFSMDSSTSTPFEMDVTTRGNLMRLKSSKLTVSGNVKFYATEMKGNLLGLVPIDFTPANPPPLVLPELFFTGVTIGLENVVCDRLTAAALTIS